MSQIAKTDGRFHRLVPKYSNMRTFPRLSRFVTSVHDGLKTQPGTEERIASGYFTLIDLSVFVFFRFMPAMYSSASEKSLAAGSRTEP